MINKIFILFFIILLSVIFSCKDNPVAINNLPYQFDSARYDWRVDNLNIQAVGPLYVPDTTNLYFADIFNNLNHHDGKAYKSYYMGFDGITLDGIGINNIYVGGFRMEGSNYFPVLKKWDGSSFSEISLLLNWSPNFYYVSSVKVISLNEIWLGTNRGDIIKFDGSVFTVYNIGSLNRIVPEAFLKSTNNFYCIAAKVTDSLQQSVDTFSVFKYENNLWEVVNSKATNSHTRRNFRILNNELYMLDYDGIYRFTNNNFNKVFNFSISFYPYFAFDGESISNFCIYGFLRVDSSSPGTVLNWNGNKFSKELYNTNFDIGGFFYREGKYFGIAEEYYTTYIIFGRKKSNIEYP